MPSAVLANKVKTGQCKVRSVVYQNSCIPCKTQGEKTRYIGKTGRTMLERSKEHQLDALTLKNKSHMRDHILEKHPHMLENVLDTFRMTVVKNCPSALTRQVREVITIARG